MTFVIVCHFRGAPGDKLSGGGPRAERRDLQNIVVARDSRGFVTLALPLAERRSL
jgi:hypothetical protein